MNCGEGGLNAERLPQNSELLGQAKPALRPRARITCKRFRVLACGAYRSVITESFVCFFDGAVFVCFALFSIIFQGSVGPTKKWSPGHRAAIRLSFAATFLNPKIAQGRRNTRPDRQVPRDRPQRTDWPAAISRG